MFTRKIGIDLGTANTIVFVPGKGFIINEPTIVALSLPENAVLAVGREAKDMIGRTPEDIAAYRPLKDKESGAKEVYLVKEPILAALGAGIPINAHHGNMIVNIGGGTSEVAVVSLGGIVSWASLRVAGNKSDQAIMDYIKKKYSLSIGEQTAEQVKIQIGSALPIKQKLEFQLRGRDLMSGLPKDVTVTSNEIAEALNPLLFDITASVRNVFNETPPELVADIMEKGIILSGGGAQLRHLDEFFGRALGVATYVAEEPLYCVAKGTGLILNHIDTYKRTLLNKR